MEDERLVDVQEDDTGWSYEITKRASTSVVILYCNGETRGSFVCTSQDEVDAWSIILDELIANGRLQKLTSSFHRHLNAPRTSGTG